MLNYLRKRKLIAGVAAEIKAQCKDQEFVHHVCFTQVGMHLILDLSEQRFRNKNKLRYFMISTFLLAETMRTHGIHLGIKATCLEMLQARRQRIESHIMGDHGEVTLTHKDVEDLDYITELGIKLYHSERRESLMEHIKKETGTDLS